MIRVTRTALELFGWSIHWYGAIIALGIALGVVLACAREKRIPFELTADPFYSSANQRDLEGIMQDVRSGKAHFAPHDLIEEA